MALAPLLSLDILQLLKSIRLELLVLALLEMRFLVLLLKTSVPVKMREFAKGSMPVFRWG